MRCPDCNKFVSYDTDQEPEVDLSVSEEGVVTGTCRIVNTCAECGTELKEANFDVEIDLSADLTAHWDDPDGNHAEAKLEGADDRDLEVEEDSEREDRTQTHDRKGRPIKSARYAKTYYGARVKAIVTCACGDKFEGEELLEETASGMEELV